MKKVFVFWVLTLTLITAGYAAYRNLNTAPDGVCCESPSCCESVTDNN